MTKKIVLFYQRLLTHKTLNGKRPAPQGIPGARSSLPGEAPQPGVPETTNNVNKGIKN